MLLVLFTIIFLILLAYISWKSTNWQRHGIQGPRGWPIVGNMWPFVVGHQHYGDVYRKIYKYTDYG